MLSTFWKRTLKGILSDTGWTQHLKPMKSGPLVSHEVFYLMRHGVAELMRHKVYEVCLCKKG